MSNTQGITGNQLLQTTLNATERAPSAGTAASTPASDTGATQTTATTTTLSGAATLLASPTDDVRTDKVAALKSAIDAGTYNVSASAVADKLITTLLE